MTKLGLLGLASLTLAACSDRPSPVAPSTAPPNASRAAAVGPSRGSPLAGRYIVVFTPGTDLDREPARIAAKLGGRLDRVYRSALRGMAIELPDAIAAQLAKEPSVALVEQDQVMSIDNTQTSATWGLDRIDQHALPLSTTYDYNADGTGVTAYIIDTGILFSHSEFGGRAVTGVDEVTAGGTALDCNGHGTHVSGTVGGATYGVAKNVNLVAVRVLDCGGSGTTAGVIAGVDWVTANHTTPAVANMSLGGGLSSALDQAVANSIASGVTYGIAAGNGNFLGIAQNACNSSPADVPAAITVGATDNTDTKASWSNYGTCVDIFGPGVNITSSWYTSPTATNTISGTSMATPHIVGAAALYLQANPTAAPSAVSAALTGNATAGVVKSGGTGSPNLLLYTAFISATPRTDPPVASFTSSCTALSCKFTNTSVSLATATYSWTFGDGSGSSEASPTHAYAAEGTYSVTLTVTDLNGTSAPSTQSVTVTAPPPTPAPVASFTKSCSRLSCTFDASATTNASSYSWTFGDGSTGSGVRVSHSFAASGSYTVTLTAAGSGGTGTSTAPVSCGKRNCS